MEEAICYRLATIGDAQELGQVHVASWRETYPGLVPNEIIDALSPKKRGQAWEQMLLRPENYGSPVVHLALQSSKIVGFGCCELQRDENMLSLNYQGDFSSIYVLKKAQGRGVGTRLMGLMADDLRSRGCSSAGVWVLDRNEPARRFYEKLGAAEIARKREQRPAGTLIQVGYGWRDLRRFPPA